MRLDTKRPARLHWFKKTRVPLIMLMVVSMSGLAAAAPPAEAQPTPARPLLLIGGTLMGEDFGGFAGDPAAGLPPVPGWHDPDGPVNFLETEAGYTYGNDLFIGEMQRQDQQPPNWSEFWWDSWDDFLKLVHDSGGSTAGLAAMEDSVELVKDRIAEVLDDTQAEELDIIAHSQAPAIVRRAIRDFVADPAIDNPVNTLVSLGGGHYGIEADAPEFLYGDVFVDFFIELYLEGCRDNGRLPVCPDIIRLWDFPSNPDPYTLSPAAYLTDFYPDLNAPADPGDPNDPGPTPSSTAFFHLSSIVYQTGGGLVNSGEGVELFPDEPNVYNWNVQDFCESHPDFGENEYPVHHNLEWVDPAMQQLILGGLGVTIPSATACDPLT